MSLSRRELLTVAIATAALTGGDGVLGRAAARQRIGLDQLMRFRSTGQITLLHLTDSHAQLKPIYYREPAINIGVGDMAGQPPHLTGKELLAAYGLEPGSAEAYALSSLDFEALARTYGRVGGMDRLATLVRAIRAERGNDRVLLLDGGDLLQGSYTALRSRGGDMIRVAGALGIEATTGHWEFTLGAERVVELFGGVHRSGIAPTRFLAGNIRDTDFEEPVFNGWHMFEKGGLRIGVIGQAFPWTAVANPRWMVPKWWFGIRELALARTVAQVRRAGADLIVLLSHNGFDVDRKLAGRISGIDVILSGHTHDALPQPVRVGRTLIVASGSHGKFLSRLDVDMRRGAIADWSYTLIPVLSDAIPADPTMAALVSEIRAPHARMLATELARTEASLHRRGNFGGTLDDLICDALMVERDAEISMSPGFRWGGSLVAGDAITWDDIYNATAITYPTVYRLPIRGAFIKTILEDVADNLFNPDPYYQQGGDMVRVGGMSFVIRPDAPLGSRISDLTLSRTGQPIDPGRSYVVAGWGSVNEGLEGPAVWDVVAGHLKAQKIVKGIARTSVTLKRG
ncbi:MAG: thiosulfohydrolase SoxB [Hyphomicrobiaceae bacterium]|nr:thiosulfohydrolase SoxB [Hyphomicrobiaceae bacterium]